MIRISLPKHRSDRTFWRAKGGRTYVWKVGAETVEPRATPWEEVAIKRAKREQKGDRAKREQKGRAKRGHS